jgi:hypothetical protein
MILCKEGEKKDIRATVTQVSGSGTWTLTTPQYRILDSSRVLVVGYDWAAATWDSAAAELYALFDSTIAVLSTVGTYYVQLRGTIGAERYETEVTVQVIEVGP